MWIFSLGETLKRATLTSHAATSRLSSELCQVLTDMTTIQASSRASLMHLLDVSKNNGVIRQEKVQKLCRYMCVSLENVSHTGDLERNCTFASFPCAIVPFRKLVAREIRNVMP